ncbi:hypothetical protein ACS0TY_011213 [Phlomoides rotata]
MAKKSKSSLKNGDPNDVSKTNEGSDSSTVFKILFGEFPEQNPASNSLFSDNNPFRRKLIGTRRPNEDLGLGVAEKDAEYDGNLGDSEIQQPKKRKKDKLKKVSEELKIAELNGPEKNEDFALEKDAGNNISVVKKIEKGKKKRKRDEVETEYETKRYGIAEVTTENKEESRVVGEKRKKMDNPEDMIVSNEGFDDESKLLRTIFVGNLPLKLRKKEIAKAFDKFGEVESVRIRSVPIIDGKIPRKGAVIKKRINENCDSVHAYIVFKTEASAQASLAHNMAVVGGNHIRVDRACPPRKKAKGENALLYDNKRTLFLGNLPFDVKDEEIYQLFSGIKNLETSVEAVRVVRDPGSSLGKGIAYVLFKTTDAANTIVKKRSLKIRDRELRLSHAKSIDTSSNTAQQQSGSHSAKKFAVASKTPDSGKARANVSYQGLHASKSGGQKKVHTRTRSLPSNSNPQPDRELKSWKKKRPSVAARKEKALEAANGSKGAGTKRKLGNRTPESDGQKKARKFR